MKIFFLIKTQSECAEGKKKLQNTDVQPAFCGIYNRKTPSTPLRLKISRFRIEEQTKKKLTAEFDFKF